MVQLLRLDLHLLPALARAFHFGLRPGSETPQLAVVQARGKDDSPSVFPGRETVRGFHPVVAAVVSVARSLPGVVRFAFVLCR